jgi:AcrR family transcriptional regulator
VTKSSAEAHADIDAYLADRGDLAPTDGRRRLMNAVLAVAVERGNSGVSMRAIAKKVNMQPASIYSHFGGGKDELVAETIKAAYVNFLTDVVGRIETSATPYEQFVLVTAGHVDFQLQAGWTDLWEVLVQASPDTDYLNDETREDVRTLRKLYREYVTALVAEIAGPEDAAVKGQLVIELLNQVTPEGGLLKSLGPIEGLRDITLGAALAVARSGRATAPAELYT